MRPIEQARQNVADRHPQPYHKRAILSGDWDTGSLVREELARITEPSVTTGDTCQIAGS